ncbi:hypothetical protein Btru_073233 [Bulinus truncatus]|nr:hypothetical protein Btru_073233 [Bulinus truncatus]
MVVEVVQESGGISHEVATTTGHRPCELTTSRGMDLTSKLVAMQHKLSKPWKNIDNDYPSMAEDDNPSPLAADMTKSKCMVSGFHRSSDMYEEGISNGGSIRSLKQKIKESEAVELKNCPSSVDNDQDSPLDFSVKRRSSFSDSLTDDSQTSSSPGHSGDYHGPSSPADTYLNHNDIVKRETPSPDGVENSNNMDHSHHHPSGIPPLAMFQNLQGSLLDNASVLNAFSQMAYLDQRSKKTSRPFKAYPKEALQMPLGFFGIPGLAAPSLQQGIDSGMFPGMNSEELVKIYNQQVQMFREKALLPASTSPSGKSSPPHPSPSYNHSPNLPQSAPTSVSQILTATSSPLPLTTSDHLRSSVMSTSPFPVTVNSGSVNSATVVSSTSFLSHSNTTSSRKRPRSLPDEQKDAAYWERRRKNNDAAKRSRDARRAKEDEIAIRAALLEQENLKLRVEVAALKTETARLRCLLYNS